MNNLVKQNKANSSNSSQYCSRYEAARSHHQQSSQYCSRYEAARSHHQQSSQYCNRYEAATTHEHPQAHSASSTLLPRIITTLVFSAFITTTNAQTSVNAEKSPHISPKSTYLSNRGADLPSSATLLPIQLIQEKQYRSAAIEYRRLALTATKEDKKAGYFWGAAYIYHLNHDETLAIKMLDFSEDTSNIYEQETTLLRLDCAISEKKLNEADFYAQSLEQSATNKLNHIAQYRRAKLAILNNNPKLARTLLPADADKESIEAILAYRDGNDKNPRFGGFLGMIPGLGYAYSGEYANALRSLIMNGLFIYAMVDTAEDDNWGAFSIITFFEITWYTGSIYGGVDSAHRYNRNRLQACIQVIDDQSQFKPDLRKMPAISLKYSF